MLRIYKQFSGIWIAKCWLLDGLCLNDENYVDNRIEWYKKLENLDPLRSGRYEDLIKQCNIQQ